MPEIFVILELILSLAGDLISIGAEAVDDAFTSEVYDALLCTVYCFLPTDGVFTDETRGQLEQAITDGYDTTVALVINYLLESIMGTAGLNNVSSASSGEGDCDGCDECEWCYVLNPTTIDNWQFSYFRPYAHPPSCSFIGDSAPVGVLSGDGTEWRWKAYAVQSTVMGCSVKMTVNVPTTITQARIERGGNSGGGLTYQYMVLVDGSILGCYYGSAASATFSSLDIEAGVHEIEFLAYANGLYLSNLWMEATLWGAGASPFGGSNC